MVAFGSNAGGAFLSPLSTHHVVANAPASTPRVARFPGLEGMYSFARSIILLQAFFTDCITDATQDVSPDSGSFLGRTRSFIVEKKEGFLSKEDFSAIGGKKGDKVRKTNQEEPKILMRKDFSFYGFLLRKSNKKPIFRLLFRHLGCGYFYGAIMILHFQIRITHGVEIPRLFTSHGRIISDDPIYTLL